MIPPTKGRSQKHVIRAFAIKELAHRHCVAQIEFRVRAAYQICISPLL